MMILVKVCAPHNVVNFDPLICINITAIYLPSVTQMYDVTLFIQWRSVEVFAIPSLNPMKWQQLVTLHEAFVAMD
jgi:hypothetical protein